METKEFTNRELSEALGVNFPKQKRHAREFLGIDPNAGQSSGVHRKLTIEQAFIVYFCGIVVNIHKVPLSDAKDLAKVLPDWLEKRLYFPILKYFPERLKQKPQRNKDVKNDLSRLENRHLHWSITIQQTNYRTVHTAKGIIYREIIEDFPNNDISYLEESYLIEKLICDAFEAKDEEIIHITYISVTSALIKFVRALNLEILCGDFCH